MPWQLDDMIDMFREDLEFLRYKREGIVERVASSRDMIERSYALLELIDQIEAEQRQSASTPSSSKTDQSADRPRLA
jgi:hypothetical protein